MTNKRTIRNGTRWNLLKVLITSSWRSRYRNSVLGFAWSVLEPLSMTFAFVVVFSALTTGVYNGRAPYPVFVLLGQVLWTTFANGTIQGSNSIYAKAELIKKIYFPRQYVVFSYVLSVFFTSLVNLGIFGILFFAYGLTPTRAALFFPVILGILTLLVTGVSLLLATIYVRVEDLRHLWGLVVTLGLFASPVIYEVNVVPLQYEFWYRLNPMVEILNAARRVVIQGLWPNASALLYPALLSVAIFALGLFMFKRNEHLFAERL